MIECLDGITNFVKIGDDNCVYSKDGQEHLTHIHAFLQRYRERGIRLSRDKFQFAKTELEFAGVVLSKEGYRINPMVYEALRDFPPPTNISEMRSFCGMANQLGESPFNDRLS